MKKAFKAREAARSWVTMKSDSLKTLCKKEGVTRLELSLAVDNFKKKLSNLADKQEEVELVIESHMLQQDIEEAEKYDDLGLEVLAEAERTLELLGEKSSDGAQSISSTSEARAKLPKLTLPSFSGKPQEWLPFWEQFLNAVDQTDMPMNTKFSYLRSLLKGEAQAAVAGLSLTASNYLTACQILKQRFGRVEKLIFCHVQDLLAVTVPNQPGVSDLWEVYNRLQSHIRSLECLEITGDSYGVILTPLVLSRLPPSIRMEWAKEAEGITLAKEKADSSGQLDATTSPDADLNFLMKFLLREIQRRERSQTYSGEEVQPEARTPSAAALRVGGRVSTQENCLICDKGPHPIKNCRVLLALPIIKRQSKLREARICFRCLAHSPSKKDHDFRRCTAKCSVCNGKHNQIVCDKQPQQTRTQTKQKDSSSESRVFASSSHDHEYVLLQTIRVSVGGRAGKRDAVVLFDTGADRSYVRQDLVDVIAPDWVEKKSLAYAAFGSDKVTTPIDRDVYNLSLQGEGGPIDLKATCIPTICAPVSQPPIPSEILSRLSNRMVSVPAGEKVKIDILIGLDAYWKIMGKEIKFLSQSLVAQSSRLGWVLSGCLPISEENHSVISTQLFCTGVEENFWSLEAIGIGENENVTVTTDPVLDNFKENITKSGNRYSVSLPWKNGMSDQLLSNKRGALKRLESLEIRLKKDKPLREQYYSIFEDMEKEGIIEEVVDTSHTGPTYYMPHHPVVKESSMTTKVRPVFDASAKGFNGVSLNDCMEAGPNFLPDLPALLIRFRRWKIGLTADVTKAFLQVGINPEDRDVHRFLLKMEEDKVREMRFTRVPFGNKCSPFLLMATIKHHLNLMPTSHTAEEIEENLYMDDLISGCDSEREGKEMFSEAQEIMGKAGMKLAKWGSNSKELCQNFENKTFVTDALKVLGMQWLPDKDAFSFEGCAVPPDLCLTKRLVLSMIARLFDPLGFLNPFVIQAKCLFQVLWREEVDWDQTITGELRDMFLSWLKDLAILKTWRIPRRYFPGLWSDNPCIVLHGFGDASQKAYGACVYVLIKRPDGQIDSSLVMSRARVAPIKEVTLPRLELLAALLCARLVTYVRQSLKLSSLQEVHCWTDSMVTLAWLQKEPEKWKTFVANRVAEIQDLVAAKHWHHCPGILNPADLLTRGISAEDLSHSDTWLKGPTDLMMNVSDKKVGREFDTEEEARALKEVSTSCFTTDQKVRQPVLKTERYHSLIKAMRVMAYIKRFVQNLKVKGEERKLGELSFQELDRAKFLLLEEAQRSCFDRELKALRGGKSIPRDSPIQKLSPFLGEDGLLKVQSRLQFAGLPGSTEHPVIVPKGHFAMLLARHTHVAKGHAGVNSMLIELRDSYWMIGARRTCKTVKAQCTDCQRVDSPPCSQYMSSLPAERVQQAPPFSVAGLDHAGPLFSASDPGKKLYILLITCAVTRAVHLELVDSQSAEDTLLALRRFFARRGMSSVLWSDNAKGFLAARETLLKKHGSNGPDWRLIAPRAPWWGGWWERLVGSVKNSLKKALGRRRLSRQELETLLHEIECCVNARPITFVGDTLDSGRPLTPSHFILGRSSPYTKAEVDLSLDVSNQAELLEQKEELLKEFWYIWKQEYLRNLPPFKGNGPGREIKEGSVVLIENEGSRISWPLGVIKRMFTGRDGLSRTVEVKTQKGIYIRPIQRLHSLEICLDSPVPIVETEDQTSHSDNFPNSNTHTPSDETKDSSSSSATSPELLQRTRSGRSVRAREVLNL